MANADMRIKCHGRDACLCIGGNKAPPAPRFVFLITQIWPVYAVALGNFLEYAAVTFRPIRKVT